MDADRPRWVVHWLSGKPTTKIAVGLQARWFSGREMESKVEEWLDEALASHARLTPVVASLAESLTKSAGIDVLTVSYRTKERSSALGKIERKGYREPAKQLTDLSGIRVVVYFESDVQKVADVIAGAFRVDVENSRNRDELMSVNEIGYRSAHYVCDLGEARSSLPEFRGMSGLKFEFQVRTVLQHAWAELAHDRNYKLGGKLPRGMERQLYLYAGMLEIADKGFDELSRQIDSYADSLSSGKSTDFMATHLDSISLPAFVRKWCAENGFSLEAALEKDVPELLRELAAIDVFTVAQLNAIIPEEYAKQALESEYSTNIYGLVRDWVLIHDWRGLLTSIRVNWSIDPNDEGSEMLVEFLGQEEYEELNAALESQGSDLASD